MVVTIMMCLQAGVNFGCVDVRDAAAAHVRALEVSQAAGQRFIVVGGNFYMQDMALALAREFGPLGYRVPTTRMPNALVWCVSWVEPELRTLLPKLDQVLPFAAIGAQLLYAAPSNLGSSLAAILSMERPAFCRRPFEGHP
jgi:hypothetical protein